MSRQYRSRRQKKRSPYLSLLGVFIVTLLSLLGIKAFGGNPAANIAVADTQETSKSVTKTEAQTQVDVGLLSIRTEPSASQPVEVTPGEAVVAEEETGSEEAEEEAVSAEDFAAEHVETGYSVTLLNGNTAGAIGTEAAARMAEATGVPQETWEYIIARESNGDPTVSNPSGAAGLFQTIPGWGPTDTVEDQINTAIHVYNNQGLAAWGMP